MALAEGLLSGGQNIMAFNQQRKENQMAQSRIDEQTRQYDETMAESTRQYNQDYKLAQARAKDAAEQLKLNTSAGSRAEDMHPLQLEKAKLENKIAGEKQESIDNDKVISFLIDSNLISATNSLVLDTTSGAGLEAIKKGGAVVDNAMKAIVQRDPDLPEGYTVDTVDRTTNPGYIIISGAYEDGRRGVWTQNGTSEDGDPALNVDYATMLGLLDDEFRTNIRGNSNMGATAADVQVMANMAWGMSEKNATEVIDAEVAQNTLHTTVTAKIGQAAADPSTGEGVNVGMKRAFRAALASAPDNKAKLAILIEQAGNMGVEVPEILTAPPAAVQKHSVSQRLFEAGITPESWQEMPDQTKKETLDVLNIRDTVETVGKWIMSPLAPAADALMLGPRAVSDAGKMIANSRLGRVAGLSEVGNEPQYSNPTRYTDEQNVAMQGTPDITLDQANASFSAIKGQSDDVKAAALELDKTLFGQIDGMDSDQIADYVEQGGFAISREDEAKLAKVLKAAEVETPEDIKKLPTKPQIAVRAWLATIAPDESTRKAMIIEIQNLQSGSGRADASRSDLEKLAIDRQNANSSALTAQTGRSRLGFDLEKHSLALNEYFLKADKYEFDVGEVMGANIQENMDATRAAIFGVNDDGEPNQEISFNKDRLFDGIGGSSGSFTKMYRQYRDSKGKAKLAAQAGLNQIISAGFQALAESEEYGSFMDNFMPDGGIEHIGGNDMFLNRLIVTKSSDEGTPTEFGIRGLGSQTQLDETIPGSVIKNLFGAAGFVYIQKEIGQQKGSLSAINKQRARP